VIPLADWVRHREVFDVVRKLRFFGTYSMMKAFRHWRYNVRRALFNYTRNYLGVCHMQLTAEFGPALREVAAQADQINHLQADDHWVRQSDGTWRGEKREGWEHGLVSHGLATSLGHVGQDVTVTLKEFSATRAKETEHVALRLTRMVERAVETVERVGAAVTADAAASMPQPPTKGDARAKRFMPRDQRLGFRGESLYLMRMEARDQRYRHRRGQWLLQMLARFLRVADLLFVTQLLHLGAAAAAEFSRCLHMARRAGLFFVEGFLVTEEADAVERELNKERFRRYTLEDGAVFEPSADDLQAALEGVASGISTTLGAVPRLITEPRFTHFWAAGGKPTYR
jgi:hypothetical protein